MSRQFDVVLFSCRYFGIRGPRQSGAMRTLTPLLWLPPRPPMDMSHDGRSSCPEMDGESNLGAAAESREGPGTRIAVNVVVSHEVLAGARGSTGGAPPHRKHLKNTRDPVARSETLQLPHDIEQHLPILPVGVPP